MKFCWYQLSRNETATITTIVVWLQSPFGEIFPTPLYTQSLLSRKWRTKCIDTRLSLPTVGKRVFNLLHIYVGSSSRYKVRAQAHKCVTATMTVVDSSPVRENEIFNNLIFSLLLLGIVGNEVFKH